MDGSGSEVLAKATVDFAALFQQLPTSYMVMDLSLHYVAVNDAYLATTGRRPEELIGQYVFDAFPPTDDALDEDGVSFVQRSFERARDTGLPDSMPLQRYAIPDGAGGMTERWWSLISVPVFGEDGAIRWVAQRAEDITDWVRERASGEVVRERNEQLSRRVQEVEADLFARAHELEEALTAQAAAAARVGSLATVAMELTSAQTVEDLCRIVFNRGLPVLGADGGVISIRGEDLVRVTTSPSLGEPVQLAYGELALDSPLPAAHVSRTGERVLLPTRAAGLAFSPLMADVYAQTRRLGWATVPLRVDGVILGALAASWVEERHISNDDVELLEGFAAQVSVSLQRITTAAAERAAAAAAAKLSESLQRSLLTEPPQPDDLTIAVRYQPAAQEAQVGGDWYDAFVTEAEVTMVVIGDVGGHDQAAAAAMGQIRNLLRGIAFESFDAPGTLLGRLDRAMQGLHIDVLATAALLRVEGTRDQRQLRWANAGHLPPVLRRPNGQVVVLDEQPDLLLGLDKHASRRDHVTPFPHGSLLVLFTDGLVESRDGSLDLGIQRVAEAVAGLTDTDPEAAADAVIGLASTQNEDDIAVLVLRVG
jgi:PAS domain S-box-containing protein